MIRQAAGYGRVAFSHRYLETDSARFFRFASPATIFYANEREITSSSSHYDRYLDHRTAANYDNR